MKAVVVIATLAASVAMASAQSYPAKPIHFIATEVPGSAWRAGQEDATAKQQAPDLKGLSRWQRKVGVVTHVFTHFPLELVVYTASVPARTRAPTPGG